MDSTSSANLKLFSEIFYNFLAGIGTFFAGFAGLIGLLQLIKYSKRESYKNRLRKQYPKEKLNILFKLVDTDKAPGKIYLVNLRKKEKYWIASASTLTDLNFFWDEVKRIQQEEFNNYKEGEKLLTSGTPGS